MLTVTAKRYMIAEDGTGMTIKMTVDGPPERTAKFVIDYAAHPIEKLDLPDFLGPWREMTDEEVKDYQAENPDDND